MDTSIRPAVAADIDDILALKRELMITPGTEALSRGGFLLGSSREQYQFFVSQANVLVLRASGRLLGFSVTLPDPLLRASDLWARREQISWDGMMEEGAAEGVPLAADLLDGRIGYFEQLAFLPLVSMRVYAPALALAAALDLAESGHRHLFATVVRGPIANLAPLPLLRIIGARRLGSITEVYPEVGRLTSDIYHLDTTRWNFGVGPKSPLFSLRERIARTVTTLRERSGAR